MSCDLGISRGTVINNRFAVVVASVHCDGGGGFLVKWIVWW